MWGTIFFVWGSPKMGGRINLWLHKREFMPERRPNLFLLRQKLEDRKPIYHFLYRTWFREGDRRMSISRSGPGFLFCPKHRIIIGLGRDTEPA